jgi:hypothetical protein
MAAATAAQYDPCLVGAIEPLASSLAVWGQGYAPWAWDAVEHSGLLRRVLDRGRTDGAQRLMTRYLL